MSASLESAQKTIAVNAEADAALIRAKIASLEGRLREEAVRHPMRQILSTIGLSSSFRKLRRDIAALTARVAAPLRDQAHPPLTQALEPGLIPNSKDTPVTVLVLHGTDFESFRSSVAAAVRFSPSKHSIKILGKCKLGARSDALCDALIARHSNVSYAANESDDSDVQMLNEAIAIAPGDVVILGGFVRVAAGWLNSLRETAYKSACIATVGNLPPGGLVFYIRRDAITSLGYLDADRFPEITDAVKDLCHRAGQAGWANVADSPSVNFYDQSPSSNERLLTSADSRPSLMLVVFAGGGGTPKTNLDLARNLCTQWRVFVLTMTADEWTLTLVSERDDSTVASARFRNIVGLSDSLPTSHHDQLRTWITHFSVQIVHFRHWLGTAPEIIQCAAQSGAKIVVSLHDFYSVCPALTLLDASGACCFGDCTAHENEITPGKDCNALESWPGQASGITLRNDFVHVWRTRVANALSNANAIVTTASSAREIISRTQPEIAAKIQLIEHGRDFPTTADAAGFEPARLVFLGEATFVKGADFFIALAQLAHDRHLPWEFHLLGKAFVEVPTLPKLCSHGHYERDALAEKLCSIRPTLIALPSRFPETYCHTLTEAWSCGVPVIAHRIGALAERIEQHQGGWLVHSLDPNAWLDQLERIRGDQAAWNEQRTHALAHHYRSVQAMTSDFLRLYETLMTAP